MTKIIASLAVVSSIALAPAAFAAQPVSPVAPDASHLTKSPAGSVVEISGQNQYGNTTNYVYKVQQDGSLKLVFAAQQND
ncbi:hypothetical protein FJU08_17180 [Martelella alba]|uniref:Uncharacterized protein n=1 Tax=Martelella alba TaxID=2590451 RepID=A0A506U7F0_9HYPH|nr:MULTISPECIES: hypothetical protein [Martelella]TPW28539.1 hypothetical protein FJU08_17180 [Martelella alba]